VKDAVVVGSDDPCLNKLIEIVLRSIISGVPLFSTVLEEPALYHQFRRWVQGGLEEKRKMEAEVQKRKSDLGLEL